MCQCVTDLQVGEVKLVQQKKLMEQVMEMAQVRQVIGLAQVRQGGQVIGLAQVKHCSWEAGGQGLVVRMVLLSQWNYGTEIGSVASLIPPVTLQPFLLSAFHNWWCR